MNNMYNQFFNPTIMALNLLKRKNPQAASYIEQMMKNGSDPAAILKQGLQSGNINQQQLSQIQQMAANFGINIPNDVINNITNNKF